MSRKVHLSPPYDALLYCLENGLLEDDLGRSLHDICLAGVCDARVAGMIQSRAQQDRIRQAFSLMPFREPRLTAGDFILGITADGRCCLIPVQYLNAHCLTVGNSGCGKTTKSRFYVLQIARHVKGMWLLDLRKREFRVLRPYLRRVGIQLIVLPARLLRVNPLQVPPGVAVAEWATRVADMLAAVLGLPAGAAKILQTTLHKLYQRFNCFNGATLYPTLFDLFEAIKADETINAPSRRSILESLEPVLRSLGPRVLAYRRAWPPHELARRHLVVEFSGLAEVDKNLLLNYLLLAEFTSRVARGISNPRMDLWICVDEAQRLVSSASPTSPSAIGDLIGLIRGTGIGLDLSVQSMAGLAPQIVSNCATKIIGRCGSFADYTEAGHSMGLTADQIRWAQLHLSPGRFIGQVGEGEYRHPFVFSIPRMRLTDQDDAAAEDSSPLDSIRVLPAPECR